MVTYEKNMKSVYTFDWDDNILHMKTKIKMDKKDNDKWIPIEVEPAEFALIRGDKENYRIKNNNPDEAFDEFVDFGPRGSNAFFEDCLNSLNNKDFAPSWEIFLTALKQGCFFAIITSRSHEYNSIRRVVEYIVDNYLSREEKIKMYINCCDFVSKYINYNSTLGLDNLFSNGWKIKVYDTSFDFENFSKNNIISSYLDKCKYYGVGLPFSNSFKTEFNLLDIKMSIQEAKQLALSKILNIVDGIFTKILPNGNFDIFNLGFSDDDKKTTDFIKNFFDKKSHDFRGSKLCVYDTSDSKIKGGIRTKYLIEYP